MLGTIPFQTGGCPKSSATSLGIIGRTPPPCDGSVRSDSPSSGRILRRHQGKIEASCTGHVAVEIVLVPGGTAQGHASVRARPRRDRSYFPASLLGLPHRQPLIQALAVQCLGGSPQSYKNIYLADCGLVSQGGQQPLFRCCQVELQARQCSQAQVSVQRKRGKGFWF